MPAAAHRALRLAMLITAAASLAMLFGSGVAATPAAANGPALVVVSLDPNGPAPGSWACLAGNPSCARHDPWWQEALLIPPAGPPSVAQFSPLGPGFSADPRLAEAVLWLWTWPDGRGLLRAAAGYGVSARVVSLPPSVGIQESVARYDARARAVEIGNRFLSAPSWLLGEVLAHELTHAAQAAAGQRFISDQAACTETELPARRNEVAYIRYLLERLGNPPADAAASLTAAGRELWQMAEGLLKSDDLPGIVTGLCASGAG